MVARKYADTREKPNTLEAIFQMAEQCSKKMLEADSFDHSNIFRVPSTINKISDAEINEVSQGHWKYTQKNQYYKGKKGFWQETLAKQGPKTMEQRSEKQYSNKESKTKDACITITKDVKYFCPTGFDKGIFYAVTKLLHKKVEQAKRSGSDNAKTINTIECDNFCNFFKIPEQLYDAAFTQVISEATPKNPGEEADWLPTRYTPSDYLDGGKDTSQVFTINKGTAWGTTFKIDTGGFVFSCLFDSGAEISCMNMDTVAALGLLGKLTRSSVTVNTASGQNMGVAGDVQVNFKISRKYSFAQTFVVCENLTRQFILGAQLHE